jgi:IPT/TIG domain
MFSGRRIRRLLVAVGLVIALPVFGQASVSASAPSSRSAQTSALPFRGVGPANRGAHAPLTSIAAPPGRLHVLTLPVSPSVNARPLSRSQSTLGASAGAGGTAAARSARLTSTLSSSTPPSRLISFPGTAQTTAVSRYGNDQKVAPPDPDIAVGPNQVVETTNSTVFVYSRVGALEFSFDLNTFLNGSSAGSYAVSDPRIVYDSASGRFFLSELDIYVPQFGACSTPQGYYPDFDVVLVSPSTTLTTHDSWYGFGWSPYQSNIDGLLGDQPGLGISSSLLASTQSVYDNCTGNYVESELLIIQKSDMLNGTISFSGTTSLVDYENLAFGLQPVQELGTNQYQYVVWNNSDAQEGGCSPTCSIGVVAVHGTPRAGNVVGGGSPLYEPMTATAVQCSGGPCSTPPADQPGTSGLKLQTDDDRFLNAVWSNNTIWTAGNTTCMPSAVGSCLDFVSVGADTSGNVTLGTQINNVGVNGADLFYPAISIDSSGNVFTVFDESSSAAFETINVAAIDSGATVLTNFTTLQMSSTYFGSACTSSVCRWGDYSGAAVDPNDPADVWVVSEYTNGDTTTSCGGNAHDCWNTYVGRYTFAGPTITSLTPNSGPVAGGQTVTVHGFDFAPDTTLIFPAYSAAISGLTPESFTFVTPRSATTAGGMVQTQATDSLGTSATSAASAYTYVGLANYVPLSPFRILDTRTGGGGAFGPGVIRAVQVTGIGATPVPITATAVVMNVTEVLGTANSLLTVFPYGTSRPNASNLNFAAGTVIPNLVTVTLGPGGKVNIYNAVGTVNVLADVEGYFTPQPATDFNGLFHPIAPVRVCDTRSGSPTPTCRAHGALGAGAVMAVNLSGGGIPGDGTAGAAVLNITGILGTAGTYLTVFPSDSNGGCTFSGSHPGSSTLNLSAGAVEANRVMVQLGPGTTSGPTTSVCVYNAAGTINVILDANGWYGSGTATGSPAGFQYQALAPTRICDTRTTSAGCPTGAIGAGTSLARLISVAGSDGIPAVGNPTVVVAIIANLTAVTPTIATVLTLYPANVSRPNASDLNLNAGEVLPNLAVVQLDTVPGLHNGDVYLFNSVGSVNAIIDIEGWFQ